MLKFSELVEYHLRLLGAVLDRLMMMMMMVMVILMMMMMMMGSDYQAMLQEELMNSLEQEYSTI